MKTTGFRQLLAFVVVAVTASAAVGEIHKVKKGETLSKIYFTKFAAPLFKQKNWRKRFQAQNPNIKNPDLIFPGQEIAFDNFASIPRSVAAEATASALAAAQVNATAQVVVVATPAPAGPATPPHVTTLIAAQPEFDPKSKLVFELGYEHFRIDSQDRLSGAKSIFLSDLSPQAKMGWSLQWNKQWSSLLQLNLLSQTVFEDKRSPAITIQNSKATRYGFLTGVEREWNNFNRTGFLLNYQERIFAHSPSVGVIVLDRIASPSFKLCHATDIFALRTARFGLNLSAEYIFSGSGPGYSTKSGTGGDVALYLKHETKNAMLSGSIYYGMTKQDSDLVKQNEKHLGALMGLAWKFE